MKRHLRIILTGVFFLAVIGVGYSMFMVPKHADACGYGSSGGQGYVPQQRGNSGGYFASKPSLTKEQAFDIVTNHVKKLNPNLRVGQINDAGNFFEAEILSEGNEVVQLMGVDKQSGRLMIIN